MSKVTVSKVVESSTTIRESYSQLTTGAKHLEQAFIIETAQAMKSGSLSVRVVSQSIKEAIAISGNAPTIRASHSQFFIVASEILGNTADAEFLTVNELLKLAQKLTREQGVEKALKVVGDVLSVDELAELAPTQTKSAKSKKSSKDSAPLNKVTLRTADEILGVTIAGLQSLKAENMRVASTETLKTLAALLAIVAKNSTPKATRKPRAKAKA